MKHGGGLTSVVKLLVFFVVISIFSAVNGSYASQSPSKEKSEDYLLAPGDVIDITVFNEPELTLHDVRIPGDGVISYPLLGRIDTSNQTVATLEKQLTAMLLNGYLKKPRVSITVSEYRPFFVQGDVQEPGEHSFTEGMTLEQALTVAGSSVQQLGKGTHVSISRVDGKTFQVNEMDFPIRPGDVITVQSDVASKAAEYVYLYGQVAKPGGYEYRSGLTVEKAIAIAGGFTPRASQRKINISRYAEGKGPRTLKHVKLTTPIMPGDVITVGESWF